MKIRDGFVTNSSSTNFMILSKEEVTESFLMERLGLKNESRMEWLAQDLVRNIMYGISRGARWFNEDEISYEVIEKHFGKESADKYEKLVQNGFNVYFGSTSSDEDALTVFFTMDSFIIDDKDFYLKGKN